MKPFNVGKFVNGLTKNVDGIGIGFKDPTTWVDTGSFLLNYRISGDFYAGIPLSKVIMIAGESGSGKSLIGASIASNAQKKNIHVVWVDSERATHQRWMQGAKLDIDNNFTYLRVTEINQVAATISELVEAYQSQYEKTAPEDRQKFLFIIDSLGSLTTPNDVKQFQNAGKKGLIGDMGSKAKMLNQLIRNSIGLLDEHDIGMVAINHTYESQDMFNPDPKISGGGGFMFAASIVVALRKWKLKENEITGKKLDDGEIAGIRSAFKVLKTRFTKPFDGGDLKIPYGDGIPAFTGMFDFFKDEKVLKQEGNKWAYVSSEGEVIAEYRKDLGAEHYHLMMKDWMATKSERDRKAALARIKQDDDEVEETADGQ